MRKKNAKEIGLGEKCPKCDIPMSRRTHNKIPNNKYYYFSEWDCCTKCSHIQHYEKFKVLLK